MVAVVGQEAPTDDQALDAAILLASEEKAATRANLQPILEGAVKAINHFGKACCPSGHNLQAAVALPGISCSVCAMALR